MNRFIRVRLFFVLLILTTLGLFLIHRATTDAFLSTERIHRLYRESFTKKVSSVEATRLLNNTYQLLDAANGQARKSRLNKDAQKLYFILDVNRLRTAVNAIKDYSSVPHSDEDYASAIALYDLVLTTCGHEHLQVRMSRKSLIYDKSALIKLRGLFTDDNFHFPKSNITRRKITEVSTELSGLSSSRLKDFYRNRLQIAFKSISTDSSPTTN